MKLTALDNNFTKCLKELDDSKVLTVPERKAIIKKYIEYGEEILRHIPHRHEIISNDLGECFLFYAIATGEESLETRVYVL